MASREIGKKGRGAVRVALVTLACGLAAACSSTHSGRSGKVDSRLGVAASPRVVAAEQGVPLGGGRYHVGKPYRVAGRTIHPKEDPDYRAVGVASWYGSSFQGRCTANGEIFDMHALSAAHPTLPLPSYVRVTNLANRRSVVVRVNDRGPFGHGRVIDVSKRTAEMLGFIRAGKTKVHVEYVGLADLDGQDESLLLASYRGPDGALESRPGDIQVAFASPPPDPASDAARLAALAELPADPAEGAKPPQLSGGLPADPTDGHGSASRTPAQQASYAAGERISAAFAATGTFAD